MFYQIRVKTGGTWGAWMSLASLGASGMSRTLTTCAVDTVEFTVTSATALTDASVFSYNAEVSLRRQPTDSTSAATAEWWFRGRVRSIPRYGSGADETYRVLIEGPWSWFQSTVFRQAWPEYSGEVLGSVVKPRAILFAASNGTRVATGPQLKAICDAAASGGAPCTVSAIEGGITPPYDEQTNITCAQAVMRVLAYHPHAVLWFDYTTETPVLKYAQRSALPTASVAMTACESLSIKQRDDLKVPAVAIYYERQNTVDGSSRPQTILDKYPANADESADGVLTAVYDLRGDSIQTVSQVVVAEAWPAGWASSVAWWKSRVPWLRDYADGDISLSSGQRLGDSSLSNILTMGAKQTWMNVGIERERVAVTAYLVARKVIGGALTEVERITKQITVEIDVTGAPVGTTVYRAVSSFDLGEETPVGVAQSLFTEWSQTHYEGSLSYVGQEPDGAVTPGTALNITGGIAGWASMAALVSRVTEQVDSGTTSVEFGPPGWTDVDARVLFERSARSRNAAYSMRFISGADSSTGMSGAASPSVVRDGNSDQERARMLLCDPAASPLHKIDLNVYAISKSAEGSTASVLQPRELYIPYVDTGDGNKVKAKLAQIIASPLYGSAVELTGTPLSSTTPAAVAASGAVGTGTTAARSDHVHAGLQLGSSTPAAVAASGSAGSSTTAAKSDHVHAGVQLTSATPAAIDGTAAVGSATAAAKADHKHAFSITLPDPGPGTGAPTQDGGTDVMPAPAGSLGSSAFYARRDHIHPVNVDDSVLPADPASAASAGTSNRYARRDHVHKDMSSAILASSAPAPVGTSNAVGTATKAAREDHVHVGLQLTSSAPAPVDGSAAAAGSATSAARADHVHAFGVTIPGPGADTGAPTQDGGTPGAPAPAGVLGTSAFFSRRDHVHPVNVDDAVLPADPAASASAGTSNRYARADHVHAGLQLTSSAPAAVGGSSAVGTATSAAKADHVHALGAPSNPGTVSELGDDSEGVSDAALTDSWTAGTAGIKLWVITRMFLDKTLRNSNYYVYFRPVTITADGRIYYCGPETKLLFSQTYDS